MGRAYLSLGSNLDAEAHLRDAVAALRARFGEVQVSRAYRFPAVGFAGGDFLNAAAAIDTPYGRLAIDWRLEDGELRATLEVPVGVRAALDLPTTEASAVTVDGGPAPEILGSGTHEVTVTAPAVAA